MASLAASYDASSLQYVTGIAEQVGNPVASARTARAGEGRMCEQRVSMQGREGATASRQGGRQAGREAVALPQCRC